jgi:hypothetical protein
MQRAQSQAQGPFIQPMLGLPEILKRRTQQNVFSQSSKKPRMQVHQRIVRRIKVDVTTQPFAQLQLSLGLGYGSK